jgi:MFS family permease
MADIGLIGILGAVAATLSCLTWGSMADRNGSVWVMRIGATLGLGSIVIYSVAPSVMYLWIAAIILGIANAATDMGLASVISEQVPQEERGAAVAGLNALTGARGMIAPFVAAAAIQAGWLDLTQALLVCAGMTGIGTVMYLRMTPSGAIRSWRSMVPSLPIVGGLQRARAIVVGVATNL